MDRSTSTSGAPAAEAGAAREAESDNVEADICVIGADPGGLAVATAAAAMGRKVVLVDCNQLGRDAPRDGSLPGRALAAVANRAQAIRTAATFAIAGREPDVDLRAVGAHVEAVIAELAPNFAAERFAGLGVRVIPGAGRFIDKRTVAVGEYRIHARRFVVATGAVPAVPPIPGLEGVPYFTVETIFSNQERLHNLIVIGGGSTGLELAQTYSRLGSRVIVIEEGRALGASDPELSRFVLEQLAAEGVAVHENTRVDSVEGGLGRVRVHVTVDGAKHVVEGSHLLIAVGSKPAISDLGLDGAGIRYDERGIKVNAGLKTTNRRVFAIGEAAAGLPASRTAADYYATTVLRRALLHVRVRFDTTLVPRLTFTDPELAYVGLSEAEAAKRGKKIRVLRWPYRENIRAVAERAVTGHVKVVTAHDGRILGAGIVGAEAGELIGMWVLAISQGLDIKAIAGIIPAQPTLSEINKSVATSYYAAMPANPILRKIMDFLAKLG